ncbi:MAG: phosphoglycerate dehydrogenase [Armatimonadetes bacterium]|nr:phosphoglycerate dehydrogenase [Armatimonadota bacterium]
MNGRVLVLASPFTDHQPAAGRPLVEAGLTVEPAPCDCALTDDELIAALRGYDATVAGMERYTRGVFEGLPDLKVVARWGVGVDNIDLQAGTDTGVIIANTPGMVTEAVADHTWALILALSRRLPEEMAVARSLDWHRVEGADVWRKTLGIIGFGSIGQAVARRARGFSMRVLAYDPVPRPTQAGLLGVDLVNLDELLAEADIVSLHASLTDGNRGMIGEKQLRLMKPTAIFVNAARGGLVDQAALARALEEGRIAGAALDALDPEPPEPDDPILAAPNCIITPHNSSQTAETAERVNAQVCDNIIAGLAGRRPRFTVNPEVFDRGTRASAVL